MEQRRCTIVSVCMNESTGENNQEQNGSWFGSMRTKRSSVKNNAEQNTFKVDIDSISVEIAPDRGIGIKLHVLSVNRRPVKVVYIRPFCSDLTVPMVKWSGCSSCFIVTLV